MTREQFILGQVIGGAIFAVNAPYCQVEGEAEPAMTPEYKTNVATVVADVVGGSQMMVEDLQAVLDEVLVVIAARKNADPAFTAAPVTDGPNW